MVRKRIGILMFFVCGSLNLLAQSNGQALLESADSALSEGAYAQAISQFQAAYEVFEQNDDYAGMAKSAEGWGTALLFSGDSENALVRLDIGIDAAEKAADSEILGSVLAVKSELLRMVGRTEEALAANLYGAQIYEGTEHQELYSSRLIKIGDCYQRLMQPDSAEWYFVEAIRIKEEIQDSMFLPHAYEAAAIFYGNYRKAYGTSVEYFLKSIELAERVGKDRIAANSLANLATFLLDYDQYEDAKAYAERALEMMDALGLRFYKTRCLNTLGHVAEAEGAPAEAERLFREALEIHMESRDQSELPYQYYRIARLKLAARDFDGALVEIRNGLRLLEERQQPDVEVQLRNLLARVYLNTDRRDEAIEIWEEIRDVAVVKDDLSLQESVLRGLSNAYAAAGNFEEAYQLLDIHRMVVDSLSDRAHIRYAQQLNAEFDRAQKDEAIMRLTYENSIKDLDLINRKRQVFLLGGGVVVAILAAMLGFFLFVQKRKNAKILEEKNTLIASALEEKDLLLREIHHRVKNNLQLVSSLLNLQSRYIKDPTAVSAINEGRSRVRSMALIHQNLYQKENLTGVHVKQYFSKLLQELFETYQVLDRVDLNLEIDEVHLDVDTIIPIGLILNELVTNALKYAFPEGSSGSLRICLKEESGALNLEVQDDGVGMADLSVYQAPSTFGFRLVQSLAAKLKAQMKVEIQEGTSVKLSIRDYRKAG